MIIPIGSTDSITLGPFLDSSGQPVRAQVPDVILYVAGGDGFTPGGAAVIGESDPYGVASYTPDPADFNAAGELLIVAGIPGAMLWYRWHQIGTIDVDLGRRVLGGGGAEFVDLGAEANVPAGQLGDLATITAPATISPEGFATLWALTPGAVGVPLNCIGTVNGAGNYTNNANSLPLAWNEGGNACWGIAVGYVQTWLGPTTKNSPLGVYTCAGQPSYTVVTSVPTDATIQADVAAQSATAVWTNTTRTLTGSGGAIGPTAGISTADIPLPGGCHPGQTRPLAAQVYDGSGSYATVEETANIAYTVVDCDTGEPVPGMIGITLTPASVLYDMMQTSGDWGNYNFRFTPLPFPEAGTYLIVVTFTGTSGTTWWANFRGRVEW